MNVHIITPFPDMIKSIIDCSILYKAQEKKHVKYHVYNLFEFCKKSTNKRIDDYPFGGGSGMILKPEPIFEAFNLIKKKIILMLLRSQLLENQMIILMKIHLI